MNDERYTFIEDVRDKKRIARGSHNKRTHCGKGGAVKFPSDYLSKKELKAMNGEVKSYRLNDPMTWKEFRSLPDDIKIVYIKTLRERFNVSDNKIFKMLGVSQTRGSREIIRLGISLGKGAKLKNFDAAGWEVWLNGNKAEEIAEEASEPVPHEITQESCENAAESVCEAKNKAIPLYGEMVFEGHIDDTLNVISSLLAGANVRVTFGWSVISEGDAE